MYKILVRLLFILPPEKAHYLTLQVFKIILKIPFAKKFFMWMFFVKKPVIFLGILFPNKIGLAAGFDKNAEYLDEFQALGFGFVEIGTVTPVAQPGNEKPRLFRLIKDESVINRMGFNNEGVDSIVERLKNRPSDLIVGGNIGKNKITPNEVAVKDYEICFSKLYDHVDYFVVNVSSPNTPDLRALQEKDPLKKILNALTHLRHQLVHEPGHVRGKKPVLLKIAPDLSETQLDDIIEIVKETGIDGIVATNTTIGRENLQTSDRKIKKIGAGGLSGKVLDKRSTEVIRYIQTRSEGTIPVIGVGGIHDVTSASDKLKAGASLLQLYTGFIYGGPTLVKKIARL